MRQMVCLWVGLKGTGGETNDMPVDGVKSDGGETNSMFVDGFKRDRG